MAMEGGGFVAGWDTCGSLASVKDVEIVGGGLAGLSLGIALRRRGVPVLVREAGTYPRHRVCGEFINGVTLETLGNLGVEEVFADALQHQKTRWWMGEEKVLEADLERPALGMSRWEMDEKLRQLFEKEGGKLRIKERETRVAKEGRIWTAGRRLEKESTWLGLKAHFSGVELGGYLEMHIGRGGYVGLAQVEEGVNVCGLFQRGKRAGKNPLMGYLRGCGFERLVERLEKGEMNEKSLTGVSGFVLGAQMKEDELCVLGDAERMIPPFTGNGMSMAFESAECAVEHLLEWSEGKLRWEDCRDEIRDSLEKRFRVRVRLALGLHHFLTNDFGRIGLAAAAKMDPTKTVLEVGKVEKRMNLALDVSRIDCECVS